MFARFHYQDWSKSNLVRAGMWWDTRNDFEADVDGIIHDNNDNLAEEDNKEGKRISDVIGRREVAKIVELRKSIYYNKISFLTT